MSDNPWDNDNNEKNPWSGTRQNDDVEFILKTVKEDLKKTTGKTGGNKKTPKTPVVIKINLRYILAGVLLLWFATGFYQVQPQEQGVVMRFGKYAYTTEPGLHYHFPTPIERVELPNVARENRIEIGFRTEMPSRRRMSDRTVDVRSENNALTGDENIVEVNFTVTWKVKDAKSYLFNIRDPETTIRVTAESAMRDAIGTSPIMEILADDRRGVQDKAEKTLQSVLDEYNAGIAVTSVQLTKADAPAQVIDAFNDVQRAKADKERLSNEAEAYRNDVLPRAKGEAEQILASAEAYKSQQIDLAKGETSRYKAVLDEYKLAKEVVARRLYIETMEAVYKNVDKVIINDKSGAIPYLPLNELKKDKTEKTEQGEN